MQILSIIRIVGLLVALFSSTMLLPAMVAFGYRDGGGTEFVNSFVIALLLGLLLWFPNRHQKKELRSKEGFLIVVLFWVVRMRSRLFRSRRLPLLSDWHFRFRMIFWMSSAQVRNLANRCTVMKKTTRLLM